ncbi:MAG: glycosyltransferase [Solobacterium sp.]|nr:glycosyltransferase [Solobacterium sp.]
MKVCYINSVCGFGSTGKIVEKLAASADSALVCYGRKNYTREHSFSVYKMTGFAGNAVSAADTILFNNNGFSNVSETRKMIEEVKRFAPDIIHLHNLHGYYLNLEVLFSWLKEYGRPVIWTLHDCWSMTGYCPHFENAGCTQYQTECRKCPYPWGYPFSLFKQHIPENFRRKKAAVTGLENMTIVTPSQWLQRIVKTSYLKDYPSEVIHNGIDLTKFHDADRQNRDGFTLLFIASVWTKEKGAEDIKKLMPMLKEGIRAVIIGAGSDQFKKLPNCTVYKHTSDQQELIRLYGEADLLINPTYEDTFPTVNIEALACGTPVITYRTGGSPEIPDEKTGMVIEKGNVAALAECINSQYQNPVFDRKDCLKRAECFSDRNMMMNYHSLYRSLLNR